MEEKRTIFLPCECLCMCKEAVLHCNKKKNSVRVHLLEKPAHHPYQTNMSVWTYSVSPDNVSKPSARSTPF